MFRWHVIHDIGDTTEVFIYMRRKWLRWRPVAAVYPVKNLWHATALGDAYQFRNNALTRTVLHYQDNKNASPFDVL